MMVTTQGAIPVPFSKFDVEVRKEIALSDDPEVLIRPVSPGDQDELREMFSGLSRETIHKRFHLPIPRVPEWMLAYLTDVDHYNKESLVALVRDEIVGHTMYARQEAREAEMAIVVEDRWQSRGIGRLLLSRLAEEAEHRGIEAFTGTVLGENRDALRFFSSVLSKTKFEIKNSVYHLHLPLTYPDPKRSLVPPGSANEKTKDLCRYISFRGQPVSNSSTNIRQAKYLRDALPRSSKLLTSDKPSQPPTAPSCA